MTKYLTIANVSEPRSNTVRSKHGTVENRPGDVNRICMTSLEGVWRTDCQGR